MSNNTITGQIVPAKTIVGTIRAGPIIRGILTNKAGGPTPGTIISGPLCFVGVVLDLPPDLIFGPLAMAAGVVLDVPPAIIHQEGEI